MAPENEGAGDVAATEGLSSAGAEEIPPVEIQGEIKAEVSPADLGEGPPVAEEGPAEKAELSGDLGPVPAGLKAKAVEKVDELAERLTELQSSEGYGEMEASRSFSHSLQGAGKGWRLMVDVRMQVRREI